MARSVRHESWVATTRFGLGAGPGEQQEATTDPRGWLLQQLSGRPAAPSELAGLPGALEHVRTAADMRSMGEDGVRTLRRQRRRQYQVEAGQHLLAAAHSERPFLERWIAFWTNHFAVSASKSQILGLVGAFEREAIRPNVLSRFSDLLLASTRHPAMQLYLDNAISTGPNSRAGQRRGRGLNENLAREILELHTLGVHGGYTQADVVALAAILTGWGPTGPRAENLAAFRFQPRRHEPGGKVLLGTRIPEQGEQEGRDALHLLARHPSTAQNIARKLACHFCSDEPPPALVERLRRCFRETDGDLRALATVLVRSDEPWAPGQLKYKRPVDLVVSAARLLSSHRASGERLLVAARRLGQLPWRAPSPQGWPDTAADWLGPEAVMRRVAWARQLGFTARNSRPVAELARAAVGPILTPATTRQLASAADATGLALLLASPAFQRR